MYLARAALCAVAQVRAIAPCEVGARDHDVALAAGALQPNVSAEPRDEPRVGATRMRFFEFDHIANGYLRVLSCVMIIHT